MIFLAKAKDGAPLFATFHNEMRFRQFFKENEGKDVRIDVEVTSHEGYQPKPRTERQNKALHLYYTHLAQELNAGGYTVQLVLKEKMELDWTPSMVKELLWRPAQEAILKKKSTTELSKIEDIDLVYDHLNRHLSEKFQIHVAFPNDPDPAPMR